jgi:hypothetical protein
MGRRSSSLTLYLACCISIAISGLAPLAAQTDVTLPDGPALGGTVDRFTYEGQGITAVTFRFSGLRSRRFGSEIGVSIFPDAFNANALLLAPDLGPAFNASGPGITVLLKGGLSTLMGIGGGFGFIPGYHLGGGMIVRAGERLGIRLDLARHVYVSGAESSEPIWSVGLGFTSLARRLPRTAGGVAESAP